DHIVRMPTWGKGNVSESDTSFLQSFAIARAEFYFEEGSCGSMKEEGLWHICWRARLRRFEMPDMDLFQEGISMAKAIPEVGEFINELDSDGILDLVKQLVGDKAQLSTLMKDYDLGSSGVILH